jgi:LysM repeat protein
LAQPAQKSAETATAAAAAVPIEPAPERPGFDVVRVDPTGETVVAGHATPKSTVELRDEGRVIAEIGADELGEFVILPPQLSEGNHRLELAARSGGAPAVVSAAVTIEVAAQKPGAPRFAPPTTAATASSPQLKIVAATPAPEAVAARAPPIPSTLAADDSVRVYVRTVEATAAGRLEVKGSAEANAIVRLYLNGSFLADASAGQDRQWSLTIERGMSPGRYTIRADEIDRSNGAVLARAEVPFSYPQYPSATGGSLAPAGLVARAASAAPAMSPAPLSMPSPASTAVAGEVADPTATPPAAPPASPAAQAPFQAIMTQSVSTATSAPNPASPKSPPPAKLALPVSSAEMSNPSPSATPPSDVVVTDVRTTTVVRGDNLWDLARRFYRDGMRFRQIYAANASQIRDPRLIYIGQIFVVPEGPPP